MGQVLALTPYGRAHLKEYLAYRDFQDFWKDLAEKYALSDLVNDTEPCHSGDDLEASRHGFGEPSPYADIVENQLDEEQAPSGESREPKPYAIDPKGGITIDLGDGVKAFISFKELAEQYAPLRGLATDADQSKFPYIRGETQDAFEHRMQVKELRHNEYFFDQFVKRTSTELFHDPLVGGVGLYGRKRLIELFGATCLYGLGYYGEPLVAKCPNPLGPFKRTPKFLLCRHHRLVLKRKKNRTVTFDASPIAQQ
jgi:hypothetical protein